MMTLGRAVLLGVVLGGCREDADAPVQIARQYAAAVRRGDVVAVSELLESRGVETLRQAAERASDQVGGRRNIDSREMLQIVDVDPTFQVARAERIDDNDDITGVRITGSDESVVVLTLVKEDGAWKVSIPLNPTAP